MVFSVPYSKKRKDPKMRTWIMGIILTQMVFWASPGLTAMFRCQDQSGTTVLTDNPAQLKDCSKLEASGVSMPTEPKMTDQSRSKQKPLSELYPENNDIHPDTSFLLKSKQDHHQESDITIPLKKIGGSFVVQANLNNERTAHLIVDTGASMTVLSTNIALDLGILGTTDNELLTVNTAGGSVQVNMNYLSSLHVGTAQANHVAVAIHDLPDIPEQIEGLLGMSFLKHFLVTLDAEHVRLILRPKPSS
jgi:clan AA aspartic protease (TIGR02281 family)